MSSYCCNTGDRTYPLWKVRYPEFRMPCYVIGNNWDQMSTVQQANCGRNLFSYDFVHGLFCTKINSVLKCVHMKLCTLYMRTACEHVYLACSAVQKYNPYERSKFGFVRKCFRPKISFYSVCQERAGVRS